MFREANQTVVNQSKESTPIREPNQVYTKLIPTNIIESHQYEVIDLNKNGLHSVDVRRIFSRRLAQQFSHYSCRLNIHPASVDPPLIVIARCRALDSLTRRAGHFKPELQLIKTLTT